VEEVRKNHEAFQSGVLDMQIEQEKSISADDIVFLDRAIPDAGFRLSMSQYFPPNIE